MRPARGPALGKAPLPVTATVLSAILHVVLAVAFVLGARAWSQSQPKTYVVHLVPAVAADGSPQGAGAMTLNVSDFPFAWYVRTVHAKITERWAGRAIPGQQPVAVFDIGRDGRISGLAIEKSSGNTYYDQAALRAITEAAPFPPLPAEFGGQALGVKLGFHFPERG